MMDLRQGDILPWRVELRDRPSAVGHAHARRLEQVIGFRGVMAERCARITDVPRPSTFSGTVGWESP